MTAPATDVPRSSEKSRAFDPHVRTVQSRVCGTNIFHREAGSGRPLVLLHGIGDSHRTWRKLVPELAQNRRLYVPDLPGCGLSGRPDASYSLDWQARVMDAWMAAVGLDDVDVVGHSYGGGVALYMLLLQQKRIRRLALIAAGGCGREVSPELRLASLPWVVEHFGQPFMGPVSTRALRALGGVLNPADEAWLREVNGRPGTARALARTVRDVIDWRGQTRHFGHRATEVAQFPPTTILWGTRDRVIPHAHALATKQVLQGAEFTTFSGCGHFPHLEQPGEVAKVLTSFFDAAIVSPVRFVSPPKVSSPVRRRLAVRLFSACCPGLAQRGSRLAA